jgi:hypothetical protein
MVEGQRSSTGQGLVPKEAPRPYSVASPTVLGPYKASKTETPFLSCVSWSALPPTDPTTLLYFQTVRFDEFRNALAEICDFIREQLNLFAGIVGRTSQPAPVPDWDFDLQRLKFALALLAMPPQALGIGHRSVAKWVSAHFYIPSSCVDTIWTTSF